MQYHHLDFYKAKEWIDNEFGVGYEPVVFIKRPKKQLPKIQDKNIEYWHSLLDYANQRHWFLARGLTDDTINEQALGFDGQNHIIPIWEHKPRESDCLSVKIRYHNGGCKYRRFGNYSTNIYNAYSCEGKETIYEFFGELDALLAYQDIIHNLLNDKIGTFSLIDGAGSYDNFDPNQFDAKYLVVVSDRKEEIAAAKSANKWCKCKGSFSASIVHWPSFSYTSRDGLIKIGTDYTEFRINHTFNNFLSLL